MSSPAAEAIDGADAGLPRTRWSTLVGQLVSAVPGGRARFLVAVMLAVLASGASVALMGVSAWLLSRAAEHPPVLYLEAAAVGVRFFGITRGVARYGERLVGHDLALRLQGALRLRSYGHLSSTTLLGARRGDLVTRLVADVEAVQDVVVRVAVPMCSAAIVVLGTSVVLATFSVAQATVLLACCVVAGWVLPALARRLSRAADRDRVQARADLAVATDQLAHAACDLVAYGLQDAALDRQRHAHRRLSEAERRGAWTQGLVGGGQLLVTGLAVATSAWLGARAVAAGQLLGRDLAVLVLTPLALHEVLAAFAQAAQATTRAAASLGRVADLLDSPPVGLGDRRPDRIDPGPAEAGLDLAGVTLGWPGGPALATGLDLRLRPGDRLAVTGRSGMGKTTLAATVMGLVPPQAGRVEVHGDIALLAQDAHVFATSLAENVRIGRRDATDEDVAEALHRAGLALDPSRVVGEQGATLSGGEARRLALARVLVGTRPGHQRVLVFDEPTEHLDAQTAETLMADLWHVARDNPVLVITHDPEVARQCNRILRLGPTPTESG